MKIFFDTLYNYKSEKDVYDFYYICRLQTGMRGAYGKPQGTVARVKIGQPLMSVRARDNHKAPVIEALRRAKFKYPGRQKVIKKKKVNITNSVQCI